MELALLSMAASMLQKNKFRKMILDLNAEVPFEFRWIKKLKWKVGMELEAHREVAGLVRLEVVEQEPQAVAAQELLAVVELALPAEGAQELLVAEAPVRPRL